MPAGPQALVVVRPSDAQVLGHPRRSSILARCRAHQVEHWEGDSAPNLLTVASFRTPVDRLVILKIMSWSWSWSWYHACRIASISRAARGARASHSRGAVRTRPCADIGAIYLNGMRDAARLHPIEYSTAPAAARGRLSVPFILKYCVKQCGTAPYVSR